MSKRVPRSDSGAPPQKLPQNQVPRKYSGAVPGQSGKVSIYAGQRHIHCPRGTSGALPFHGPESGCPAPPPLYRAGQAPRTPGQRP